MNQIIRIVNLTVGVFFSVFLAAANAHFGSIIPSDDIVSHVDSNKLELEVKFIHPMEMHYMDMEKPKQFGVFLGGRRLDLVETLEPVKGRSPDQNQDFTFWKTKYQIKQPGDYTFYVVPSPYWEPAEDLFIVHYAKVCINAFGMEENWEEAVGLETEIIPLTRPYGLWTGNIFTGQVLLNGKPVPHAEIEIEYLNESKNNKSIVIPPSDPYVTQVVKADANGIFSYAMPRAGWWAFSALNEAEWKLQYNGKEKAVEIGAVYWVHVTDMK